MKDASKLWHRRFMHTTPKMLIGGVALALLSSAACGKSEEKKADTPTESKKTALVAPAAKPITEDVAPVPEPKPKEAFGEVVLETVSAPLLGEMQLPKGAKASGMTEQAGHYKFALSEDGFENIYVDYEVLPQAGAKNLKKATSLAEVVTAGTIVSSETIESGIHIVEKVRESDKKVFVIAFRPDAYVKCWGPVSQTQACRDIAKSVPMPVK